MCLCWPLLSSMPPHLQSPTTPGKHASAHAVRLQNRGVRHLFIDTASRVVDSAPEVHAQLPIRKVKYSVLVKEQGLGDIADATIHISAQVGLCKLCSTM